MTTGTHPLKAPAVRTRASGERIFGRLGRGLAVALNRVQYARQVEALSRMPGHLLAEIGLRRSEIPAYAWRLVYEKG